MDLPSSTPSLLKIFLPVRFCMVLTSTHIKVRRNAAHVNPSLTRKKKGLGFYYVNFIGTFPSCPYIQQSVWIQLQLHFTPTHLLAHCYSYLFSGDLRNSKKSPSPLGKRGGRSNSLRHSCIVTLGVNYALKLFKHRPQLLPS